MQFFSFTTVNIVSVKNNYLNPLIFWWGLLFHLRETKADVFFPSRIKKELKRVYVVAKSPLSTLQRVYMLKDLKKYLKHYLPFPMQEKKQTCQSPLLCG